VRQITRFFYVNPALRAQQLSEALALHASLEEATDTQQIKEIFDLFDTNGGGSIDPEELDAQAALFALGFQRNKESSSKTIGKISSDSVTLEDFMEKSLAAVRTKTFGFLSQF
jgi:Ca2+-binding EF-hand superfamily protein